MFRTTFFYLAARSAAAAIYTVYKIGGSHIYIYIYHTIIMTTTPPLYFKYLSSPLSGPRTHENRTSMTRGRFYIIYREVAVVRVYFLPPITPPRQIRKSVRGRHPTTGRIKARSMTIAHGQSASLRRRRRPELTGDEFRVAVVVGGGRKNLNNAANDFRRQR